MTNPATSADAECHDEPVASITGTQRSHRSRRWLLALTVAALLAAMSIAMITAATAQSPVIDEPVYAGAAVAQVQDRTLLYNPEHPPLGKIIIGTGLAAVAPPLDPEFAGNQSELGRHLLYESGSDPQQLMLAARLPMIALTLLFGLAVFGFARDLTGTAGGLVALALFAFSPNLIAHGSLATLDVAMAGFLLVCCWLLWRARQRPLPYLLLAGVALGAALATKMSALAAVPVLLVLAGWSTWHAVRRSQPHQRRRALACAGAAAGGLAILGVAVVWLTYLAVDPQLRWQTPAHVPAIDGWRELAISYLPLPEPYRDGMRIQFGFEERTVAGFLFGEAYLGSRWYYLPAALLVKTPLAGLVLWLAGAVALVSQPRLRPAAAYLLLPAGILLLAAMTGARDYGIRYVIFLPMFLAVAAAAVTVLRWRWAPILAVLLAVLVAVSSLLAYPYYLPYANEAFGGPARTHQHLHDSNVDWGQDLVRLGTRLEQHYPDEQVWLVYKGAGVPAAYGIEAADPLAVAPEEVDGLLVVSRSAAVHASAALRALIDRAEPIDHVGHSLTIYRLAAGG